MVPHLCPFGVVELVGFVQDVRVNGQLAHVMEEGRPAQPVTIRHRKREFLSNQVGERPHPLGVATGESIMGAQRGRKSEDLLSGQGQVVADPVSGRLLDPTGEITSGAGLASNGQTRGCPVGKDHGHVQEHRQGKQATGKTVGEQKHRNRNEEDVGPPHDLPPTSVRLGDHSGQSCRCRDRNRNGGEKDQDADQGREGWKCLPPSTVGCSSERPNGTTMHLSALGRGRSTYDSAGTPEVHKLTGQAHIDKGSRRTRSRRNTSKANVSALRWCRFCGRRQFDRCMPSQRWGTISSASRSLFAESSLWVCWREGTRTGQSWTRRGASGGYSKGQETRDQLAIGQRARRKEGKERSGFVNPFAVAR